MTGGWTIKALGDICDVVGGGTPAKDNAAFFEGDIPWATVRDMKQEVLSKTEFCISNDAVKNSSTNIIPAGNVVIATRVGLGKVCLLQQDTAINQDLRAIIPKASGLDVRYLFRWLQGVAHVIEAEGTGATVKGVKLPFVKSLQIPLPSLPEQKRIVAILDEAFAGIETAIANTEKSLANARELFDSYLTSVFRKNASRWTQRKLELVCRKITVGHVGSMKSKYVGTGIPMLRSQNIRSFSVDLNNVVYIDDEFHAQLSKSALQPGDLGIVRTGYPGTAAVIPDSIPRANCSDLVIVRPGDAVSSEFLALFFNSSFGKASVGASLVGAAQKHFNVTAAKKSLVPIPAIDEQLKVVSECQEVRMETSGLESNYAQQLDLLHELKQSLLQKAFAGDLTADKAEKEVEAALA